MTEQEQPRCPYCDEVAFGKWGVIYGDGTPGDDVPVYEIHCTNKSCYAAGCLIQQITKANCIRQASNLKLVDRLVREAVDAERNRCIGIIAEQSYRMDSLDLQKLLAAIRARNQTCDETKEKGTT